jgi:hypothetical protein
MGRQQGDGDTGDDPDDARAQREGVEPSALGRQGTAVTRVRLVDGLACEIEEGAWKLVADMSPKSGGEGKGPNPGILGRGALGSCLAIGYAMWAARLGVPLTSLEVEV